MTELPQEIQTQVKKYQKLSFELFKVGESTHKEVRYVNDSKDGAHKAGDVRSASNEMDVALYSKRYDMGILLCFSQPIKDGTPQKWKVVDHIARWRGGAYGAKTQARFAVLVRIIALCLAQGKIGQIRNYIAGNFEYREHYFVKDKDGKIATRSDLYQIEYDTKMNRKGVKKISGLLKGDEYLGDFDEYSGND
jgi:hypothetical protein